jgi:hypothetical protein
MSLESLQNGVMHGDIVMLLVKCDAIGKLEMELGKWRCQWIKGDIFGKMVASLEK